MEINRNPRGFEYGTFTDLHGKECSIQKSSLATDDAIWLGVHKPKLIVFENENMGKYLITEMPKTFQINSFMHLNKEQVAELIPILQRFVETGELS